MRVLFFSPYLLWGPHLLWEVTMAHALRQANHVVRFVTCEGLPDCGQAPAARCDHAAHCAACAHKTQHDLRGFRLPAEFMQGVLQAGEQEQIAAWANGLPAEELPDACFEGMPLGQWAVPDLISYWRTLRQDLSRPEVARSCRDLLYGMALAATTLPRIYDKFRPDVVVTLNGSFTLQRVAFERARQRGLRVITHERGWLENSLCFNSDGLLNNLARYQRLWQEWKDVPLTTAELVSVETVLRERRCGVNMNWAAFSPPTQEQTRVREQLNLPDGPLALLCTSSDAEGSIMDRHAPMGQWEWIAATIAWFACHPHYTLVVRVHPNERDHARINDAPLRRYEAKKQTLPANVRMVLPEEAVSTYALMDVADVGLTYGTTAGLEMACMGMPTVHAGIGYYRDAGFAHELQSEAHLPVLMAHVMADANGSAQRSPEIRRMAYRFMRRLFVEHCLPLKQVKASQDYASIRLTWEQPAELAPGQDPQLDRIVSYIVGDSELYPPPTPADHAKTSHDEDRYFVPAE